MAHHVTVSQEVALSALRDTVALWYVNRAGADGLSLCLLAGASIRHADEEVPELLEAALLEVGLAYHWQGTEAATEAGIRVMASRVLSGVLAPRAFAAWVLATFGSHTLDVVKPLKNLGWAYEFHPDEAADELDADVMAEAARIVAAG